MTTRTRSIRVEILLTTILAGCGPKFVGSLDEATETSDLGPGESTGSLQEPATGATGESGVTDSGESSTGASPTDLPSGGDARTVVDVSIHSTSACALLSDGAVRCWGSSHHGALGYGHLLTLGDDEAPWTAGDVPLGAPALQVSVGGSHACAVLQGGAIKCWGHGYDGSLGYGDIEDIGDDETPADVGFVDIGEPALRVFTGWRHNCALLAGGRIRCWGENLTGELGYGHTQTIGDDETPALVGDVDVGGEVVDLSLGMGTTCARLADGGLRCWGGNEHGAIGLPGFMYAGDDELPSALPLVDVGGPIVDVASGSHRTCALLASGEVRCFGMNWSEALGGAPPPANCLNGDDDFSCAVDSACCIGDDEAPSSQPTVDIGATAVALSGAGYGTCALLDTGGVRCWGTNRYGLMGHGITPAVELCYPCNLDATCCIGDDESPAALGDLSLGGPAAAISVGQGAACARMTSGAIQCWGYNKEGELGLGHTDAIGDDELPSAAPPVHIVQ